MMDAAATLLVVLVIVWWVAKALLARIRRIELHLGLKPVSFWHELKDEIKRLEDRP